MSLDVYLYEEGAETVVGSGIFIREDGRRKEISRQEWDERFPDREPVVADLDIHNLRYNANITHNLSGMAEAAGLYFCLWEPEKLDICIARQLIAPLRVGWEFLLDFPEFFQQFNPSNGWGNYDVLVAFVREYLDACESYPDALVYVSR